MKLIFLSLSFFISISQAATLSVVRESYKFEDFPEYQAILSQLKSFGDFSSKSSPDSKVTPILKPMSRGAQIVEEAKARNRAILAEQNKQAKVSAQKTDLSDLDALKAEDKRIRDGWKKEVQDQRKQWQREQEIFLGRLKEYKENTFVIPAPREVIVEKKIIPNLPDVHIINGAFQVPIRDQGPRPTCSAFAGIRAIEALLVQNKMEKDLSEQYFYWASKPDCQRSPCENKGSWVTTAFKYSQKQPSIDIPTEGNCSYKNQGVEKNETQIPLTNECHQGTAKVLEYDQAKTLADVIENLKKDIPVVMAAKLSENFYKNQGLVTLADSEKGSGAQLDAHALGHAFLAVGVMELPEKLKAKEGSFCIVIANSWGKGWGAGGYSCLTQNWLTKYRQPSPFMTVTKVSVQ